MSLIKCQAFVLHCPLFEWQFLGVIFFILLLDMGRIYMYLIFSIIISSGSVFYAKAIVHHKKLKSKSSRQAAPASTPGDSLCQIKISASFLNVLTTLWHDYGVCQLVFKGYTCTFVWSRVNCWDVKSCIGDVYNLFWELNQKPNYQTTDYAIECWRSSGENNTRFHEEVTIMVQ